MDDGAGLDDDETDRAERLGVASLMVSVLALCLALVSYTGPLGIALGLASLALGAVALLQAATPTARTLSRYGLAVGGATLLVGVLVVLT